MLGSPREPYELAKLDTPTYGPRIPKPGPFGLQLAAARQSGAAAG